MTSSFGIDCAKFKGNKAPIVTLDLLTSEGMRLLWHYLANDRVIGVWMAPPCGTASKAREIDNGGPPPLRSDLQADGLDNLSPQDQERVSKANTLYLITTQVADYCFDTGLFFFIENPFSSIYWKTSFFRSMKRLDEVIFQSHVACAYGSMRPKRTLLASNVQEVTMICHKCPGNHRHLKWGQVTVNGRKVFATSTEKHYPAGLCAFVSKVVLQICENHKLVLPMDSLQTVRADFDRILAIARAQTSQFTRSKLPPLLSEYSNILKVVHQECNIKEKAVLQSDLRVKTPMSTFIVIPKHSKLLTKLPFESGGKDEEGNFLFAMFSWGVQWSCEAFIDAAVNLGHPKSFLKALPCELERVVESLTTLCDYDLVTHRSNWLKRWTKRASDLSMDEVALQKQLDIKAREVVKGKRILLFEEMLRESQYYDMDVINILKEGVPMVGAVKESGHFARTFKPALITVELLEEKSLDINRAILAATTSSGNDECDRYVYDETVKEVSRGWLEGPIERDSVPKGSSISRRFGIWQKDRYRCIDDYSASLVNSSCSVYETPFLHTIDMSCALLDCWMKEMAAKGRQQSLLGRSFDLKAAYRQLFIAESHRRYAFVSVYNPDSGRVEIFKGVALPFGSVQSVYNFLRISHAIWFVGATQLLLPWTFFYDDFLCYSSSSLAPLTESCVSLFFNLIGWRIATEGSKAESFCESFKCLGVMFDLRESLQTKVYISNTEGRREEITREISAVLENGKLTKSMANKLRGRMQFAENQIFGRLNRRALKAVSEHAAVGNDEVTFETRLLLQDFLSSLNSGKPRTIDSRSSDTWFIFTDAFYGSDATPCAGLGGVLVSPGGEFIEYFSEEVCNELAVAMGHGHKGTIIFEAELLAVWIAMKFWSRVVKNAMLVFYVDNDALRGAYAASSTRAGFTGHVLEKLNLLEEQLQINVWVSRVPTFCNIADDPSRFKCEWLEMKQCKRIRECINMESLKF